MCKVVVLVWKNSSCIVEQEIVGMCQKGGVHGVKKDRDE
jgi:hypothetical protein